MEAPSPYLVLLANLTAFSKFPTNYTAIIGPKISSVISIESFLH